MIGKICIAAALAVAVASAQSTPEARAIAERITPADLRADVSFLASDALEGRATPSQGLNIAAEFIAAQFRRAGLEPLGDDGYFQTAPFVNVTARRTGFSLVFRAGAKVITVPSSAVDILIPGRVNIRDAAVLRVGTPAQLAMMAASKEGRIVVSDQGLGYRLALAGKPALVVLLSAPPGEQSPAAILRPADDPLPPVPVIVIRSASVRQALRAAGSAIRASVRMPAAAVEPVTLRNIVGVLPGADGPLSDSYLLLTAHYDHIGVRPQGQGDRVFNGANDNASGSAALVGIARALAALPARPKRSIVFAALFGEELGGLGSRYYVAHPPVPIEKTVADINLEQLGRTDDSEGQKLLQFNLTGYDFSTLGRQFAKAAPECGVQAVNDTRNGDEYFERSDNVSFSKAGMPSTTISVAYAFPDYHGLGDEWPKIAYDNMSKVACGIAIGALDIANSPDPPHWHSENPRTRRYIK